MQINPWHQMHYASRLSVSYGNSVKNSLIGQLPNQDGTAATQNSAVVASFGQVNSSTKLTYSPSDLLVSAAGNDNQRIGTPGEYTLSTEDAQALITKLHAAQNEPKPDIQMILYKCGTIEHGLLMATKFMTDDMNWLWQADENGRTAIHKIGEMLTQGANAIKNMPNSIAEERAMQREAVVRIATEMAESYGFNKEATESFMAEVYREVGVDSALDTGHAITNRDGSTKFIGTELHSGASFLRDNMTEDVRKHLERVFNEPIDLNNLNASTLKGILDIIHVDDFGYKRELFAWAFRQSNNPLTENARVNFDLEIEYEKYSSVKQWQNDAREFLGQFPG